MLLAKKPVDKFNCQERERTFFSLRKVFVVLCSPLTELIPCSFEIIDPNITQSHDLAKPATAILVPAMIFLVCLIVCLLILCLLEAQVHLFGLICPPTSPPRRVSLFCPVPTFCILKVS